MVGMVTNGTMTGVLMNGMMTGVLLDGTKVGNKRMTLPQAHFHMEVLMSVPPVVRSGLSGWRWIWTQRLQWTHSHWALVQKQQEMEDSIGLPVVNGFQMVELGSFKDTMKTVCADLWMEDSLVYTKCCAVLQNSRAKDDKICTSDTTVDTWFLENGRLRPTLAQAELGPDRFKPRPSQAQAVCGVWCGAGRVGWWWWWVVVGCGGVRGVWGGGGGGWWWCVGCGGVRWGAVECGVPDPLPRTPCPGPPLCWTAQNVALFFPLPPSVSLFFSLWGSSRVFLVVFWSARTLKCARFRPRAVVWKHPANQTWKIVFQKRFLVIQTDSMCQAAIFCRGWAWNENSESLQVDWKRESTFHCNLIPHLENIQNHP